MGTARLGLVGLVAIGVVAIAPVWLSPVLVTTDGPSHVYNAFLGNAVRSGRQPFATYFAFAPGGIRPNQAAEFLLAWLGRLVGWPIAERALCTVAIVATLAVLARLSAGGPLPASIALASVAGWLSQGWFLWMGFYDFALSLAGYAALVLVLRWPPTPARRLSLLVVFAALYLTHLLTFAVGVGLAIFALGARAMSRRERWVELAAVAPAVLLVLLEVAGGGAGAPAWADPRRQLPGLVLGDFVMSLSVWDTVAGVAIMTAVWYTVVVRLRDVRRQGLAAIDGAELYALGLLALSVIGPDQLGEGGFVAIRLRCFGVLTFLPVVADEIGRLSPRLLGAAGAVLFLGLFAHAAAAVRLGRVASSDVDVVDGLLTKAGAREGSWVVRRFTGYRRTQYGIAARSHLPERVAVRRGLIVLDNYEALYEIFAVAWRRRPDWAGFAPTGGGGGLAVRLVPGEVRWPGSVYVIHDSGRALEGGDPRLELGPTLSESSFAVTPVRRRGAQDP